ncbi:diguanylate cyclase [Lysinibacillus sphaericus]|uniref:tetratricopeptide repeat-containing diguanylate cyclase n=1 Tax=Lysinibacillus sphaericus TaxID=1421 RepID=UPI002162749C|nr:tetratricopeptide repeat-containing diguanylate cyclase [Lysinibacillus sphaericus]MCS1382400.1 diguanylate cyclase [Lysinibacillus sphaericus]
MELTLEQLNKTILEMRTKGRLTEALTLAEQGLLVALENDNHRHGLDLFFQKILIHHALGDTLSMVRHIQEYEECCQKYGTKKDFMNYNLVMSLIYDLVGFREKTVEMTKKSIEYATQLKDIKMLVRCHSNLCYLEVENGCYMEALEAAFIARNYNVELAKTLPELAKLQEIRIHNNMADVYILEGDFVTAQALLDQTLNSEIIQNHKREKVAALFGYGFLYEHQHRLEEAVDYYKQAIELAQSYGDNPITKKVMRMLLNVLYQLDYRNEIFDVQRAYIELSEKMSADNMLQQVMNLEFNRQKETLEKRALYDPLTGVLNRHFLDIELNDWLNEAQACHQYVGVIVLDIDYFKAYNDQYGHLFGDMVLQLLATGLKDFLYNQEAVIIRYGGDEFIICLRHKSKMFLNDSIKELHAYMLTLKLEHEYDSYPLKVSLGACLNDQKNYEYIKLFKQADRNLYKAKNNGRASYVISVQ